MDNPKIILYILWFLSFLTIFLLLLIYNNTENKNINKKMKKINKKEEKLKFKLNPISLLKAFLSWNQYVYDPTSGKEIINYSDFFLSLQENLVKLVKINDREEKIFNIWEDDLEEIIKVLWGWDIMKIQKIINQIIQKNNIPEIVPGSDEKLGITLLKWLIIQTINNNNYNILTKEAKDVEERKKKEWKIAMDKNKRYGEPWITITAHDEKNIEEANIAIEIFDEVWKNFPKITKHWECEVLYFDSEKNELHIFLKNYSFIFHKEFLKMIKFYKNRREGEVTLFFFI